jgi:signal transduction histidine kinase
MKQWIRGDDELGALANHLEERDAAILKTWQAAVKGDSLLTVGNSLRPVDLLDHIPALLATFRSELREFRAEGASAEVRKFHQDAALHGLKRWQQGYDLNELIRELGKLNVCVVEEIDRYTELRPTVSHAAISIARRVWAGFSSVGIEESVRQYFLLQREEASGQVRDLESALTELRALESQRNELWHQAAHDLRGNLGVVANASVGLTHSGLEQASREEFVRILIRNVTSLHQLLDDVTGLARLNAGREKRRLEHLDVAPIIEQLCEGIRPVADQKRLYLRCEGPQGFAAQGDEVKLRRIAQNLILNAVKFTRSGGITVSWGDSSRDDPKHWELCIADTGPGFPSESGRPLSAALQTTMPTEPNHPAARHTSGSSVPEPSDSRRAAIIDSGAGEGLGLSIVKRLCEILDATLERSSAPGVGTSFRIRFPREYPQ